MKQYFNFIKENQTNDDFQSDYKKLKSNIVDFENRINVGFGDQFKKIVNRTDEDVKSISDKNIELMNQEKEKKKIEKEETEVSKKISETQGKIESYLSQLLNITHGFKVFGDIPDMIRGLKVKDIDVEVYKNIVDKIYKLKLTDDDKTKIKTYREKKGYKSIPKIIYGLNQLLDVKIEKPKTKIFRYKEDFYTVNGYLNDENKKVTAYYQKNPEKYDLVPWDQVEKKKKETA